MPVKKRNADFFQWLTVSVCLARAMSHSLFTIGTTN